MIYVIIKVDGVFTITILYSRRYVMRNFINNFNATIEESSRWVDEFCNSLSGDTYDRMDTYGLDYEDASDINIGVLWSERLA